MKGGGGGGGGGDGNDDRRDGSAEKRTSHLSGKTRRAAAAAAAETFFGCSRVTSRHCPFFLAQNCIPNAKRKENAEKRSRGLFREGEGQEMQKKDSLLSPIGTFAFDLRIQ